VRPPLISLALFAIGIAAPPASAALAQTVKTVGGGEASLPPAQAIVWNKVPGKQDLAYYEPDRAQRMAQDGDSSMRCELTTTGSLQDCAVTAESPAGYGFGSAIFKLARYFKAAPSDQARQVDITIHWGWRGDRTVSTATRPAI